MAKSRRMRLAGHVARIGKNSKAYMLLVGKLEGRRSLGRQRHRWVDNINMNLGEIGWGGVDWIGLTQDGDKWRDLENAVMKHKMLGSARMTGQPVASRVMLSSLPAYIRTENLKNTTVVRFRRRETLHADRRLPFNEI
jgi:hypothetical protein